VATTGLIFDMDGLLIDSEPLWQDTERKFLAQHGCVYNTAIAKKHVGFRFLDVVRVMKREYCLEGNEEWLAKKLVDMFRVDYLNKLTLLPGADNAVRRFGALFRSAIASSSPLSVIRDVVSRFQWNPPFGAVCSGDEVDSGKPSPDVFLLAAERLMVPPRECCVLEDSLTGVLAAKAAGMRCIAVPTMMFADPVEFVGRADIILGSLLGLTDSMIRG